MKSKSRQWYCDTIGKIEKNILPLVFIILFILIWAAVSKPASFYTVGNLVAMAYQIPEFGILSLGMAVCMISGGIDLSLVGIANLCSVTAALTVTGTGSAALAILSAAAVGVACGAFNGVMTGVLGIPPMLVTLGGLQIFTGLATAVTKGVAITGIPEGFLEIGNGLLFGAVPISLVLLLVSALLLHLVLRYTVYGQQVYMMGTNATASRYTGINNVTVNIRTYALSGLLASLSGIIMCSRYGSANADYGSSYTLLTLLIAVLGGINPDGGKGRIFGVLLSIVILQLVSSMFNIFRFNSFLKTCIWGLILMVVMVINHWALGFIKTRKPGKNRE